MSTVVVGEITPEQFALEETFRRAPELVVEAERAVDHCDSITMPLLWTRGADPASVSEALDHDPTVTDAELLAERDGKQLFRITWSSSVINALTHILDADASLLNVSADANCWRFQVFYPERQDASMTIGHDLRINITRVGQLETESTMRYGLSAKQHEALRVGWDSGYFNVPRKVGIEELSEALGISHQAASERLRRGHASLIREAFGLSGQEDGEHRVRHDA